jgi:hypothetical protein
MKIQKQVIIIVEQEDVSTLQCICELARRHISERKKHVGDERTVDEYSTREVNQAENMMSEIFDAYNNEVLANLHSLRLHRARLRARLHRTQKARRQVKLSEETKLLLFIAAICALIALVMFVALR